LVHRRTLALDADLIDKLKEIAKKRGTTLSNYLRSLLREAIDLEDRGYYAPKALRERKYEYLLMNLGFTYVPKELVNLNRSDDSTLEGISERLGSVLRELGINVVEIIDILSSSCSNVITDSKRIVILTLPNSHDYLIAKLIAGIAKSAGLSVKEEGALVSIEIPEEELSRRLSEFRRGRSRSYQK